MTEDLSSMLAEFEKKQIILLENYENLSNLAKKIDTQLKKDKEYNDQIVDTFKKYQSVDSDIIRLNVGGNLFSTLKSTLIKKIKNPENDEYFKPNILEALVNNYAEAKQDENKAIFIDRDSKYFGHILNYLRMANTENEFELPNNLDLKEFKKEAQYFNIEGLIQLIEPVPGLSSKILNKIQKKDLMKLCEFPENIKWNLLYRASRDGFSANSFHSKCDYQSETLTIIKTTVGYIFGGYTNQPWDQSGGYKNGGQSFIFSLINKTNQPIKIPNSIPSNGIYCYTNFGPTFGVLDFYISDNSNINSNSYSNLCISYKHPLYNNGTNEAKSFLAGSYNFQTVEIEVFLKNN